MYVLDLYATSFNNQTIAQLGSLCQSNGMVMSFLCVTYVHGNSIARVAYVRVSVVCLADPWLHVPVDPLVHLTAYTDLQR